MTAGQSEFTWLASSSLPPVNGDSWNGYNAPTSQPQASFDPNNSGMDLNRIQQLAYALQQPSSDTSVSGTKRPISVLESIHERRDNIINTIFRDEMQKTRERCDKMHVTRMMKDWEKQKELYMNELVGGRRLGGSSNVTKLDSINADAFSSHSNPHFQIADYVGLIKDMKNKPDPISTIYEFTRLASSSPSYSAAWKLVYALHQKKQDSPVGRAIATMSHLSRQFHAHISNRVRAAPSRGPEQPGATQYTGMARTVAQYVNLTVGSGGSHWATVYYCLRCGDFVSAKQVLDANEPNHELVPTLGVYCRQQGSENILWDQISVLNTSPIAAQHQDSGDDFENVCMLLFARQNPPESSVVKTIEDFVYISLWHAIFGAAEAEANENVVIMGRKIKELGSRHFQGDASISAWSYVTPLLLTQQYYTAMMHLVESDGERGILQATHLSLFLPEIQDLGEPPMRCLLTNLLVEFASRFIPSNPKDALEYLVLIPDPIHKRKKVVELIVDSRQFEELAGVLSADGVRRGEKASLDLHFSATVVCELLHEAALVAHSRKNMRDALELLNLAEHYVSLLAMLNEKLGSMLIFGPGQEREFWIKACRDFNNWHFSGRRTRAIEVIEADGSTALVQAFHVLLKFLDFLECLFMKDFNKAISIIDGLYLLPQSSDELQTKVSSYILMDPTVKKAFPAVLEGAMDALYQQFVLTKETGIVRDAGPLEERRRGLRAKATLITSFAGALKLPLDVLSRMTGMEALMI